MRCFYVLQKAAKAGEGGDTVMTQTFMKEKKILPLVLSMSLPMVISMAVNSLYNIVDSYFVAKLSEEAMTALALVYPVQNLITSIAVGFGIGINACVAFYLGADDKLKANNAASSGVFLSIIHGILLMIFCIGGMPLFVRMFSSDEVVIGMAMAYSRRAFAFAIMVTVGIAFEKIFQATGRMKVSMISMICGFVTNIVLDPLMIFGIGPFPRMEISGAAYATGIGQTVTLLVYLGVYAGGSLSVQVSRKKLAWDRKLMIRLYGVGIPATLNMALPSVLISALNGILAGFSQSYVLVLGVYYKLQTFIYLTANGIIQGIRPLVGYNYGAGELERVHKIFSVTLKLTAGVMAAGMLFSWILPHTLIGLFTTQESTVSIGVTALHYISFGFIVSAVSITVSGVLEGLGKGSQSLLVSLARYLIIIVPAAFLLSRIFGAKGVWMAFAIAEFITAGFAYAVYRKAV